jgi:L-ascorbate metabolism protein UlaG (beta-lactamase superfamily)
MHYDTFPVIEANPDKFKHLVSETSPDTKVIIIKPGESTEIKFNKVVDACYPAH